MSPGDDDGLRLVVEDAVGKELEEIVLGPRTLTVGRGRHCGIRLSSPFVSQRHATIQPRVEPGGSDDGNPLAGDWSLTPLGVNGTRINQRLAEEGRPPRPQSVGDLIEIPGFSLRVVDPRAGRHGARYRLRMNRRYSEVTAALHEHGRVVLQAPPGAGNAGAGPSVPDGAVARAGTGGGSSARRQPAANGKDSASPMASVRGTLSRRMSRSTSGPST